MITTTSMRQLIAAVLEKDIDAATEALLKVGVIDFIDIREITAEWTSKLQGVSRTDDTQQARDFRKRLDAYIGTAGFLPSDFITSTEIPEGRVDLKSAEQSLDEIGEEIRRIREQQKQVQDEVLRFEELRRQMPQQRGGVGYPDLLKGGHAYISVYTGRLPRESQGKFEEALEGLPAVYVPGSEDEAGVADYIIVLRREKDRLEKLLRRYGWEELSEKDAADSRGGATSTDSSDEDERGTRLPIEKIDRRLEELRNKQRSMNEVLKDSISKKREEIGDLWTGLRVAELSASIRSKYRKTDRTYLFSGWLPADRQEVVNKALNEATEGRCYLEWHNPHTVGDPEVAGNIPVQMRNPKLLNPFQSLVQNYGTPAYGSIDPTPIVAVFYLAMFGLMFGDAGHGLVVFLIGLAGIWKQRRKGHKSMLFPLITWCGGAAMLAGVLFGSYFGMALFPPLWFDYHGVVAGHGGTGSVKTLTDILLITIYFGIVVISVGLLLNWINRIRRKDLIGLVWGNGGLLVGWIYAAGTWAAFYFVAHEYKELPGGSLLFLTIGIPVLLMGAKPIVEHFHHQRVHGKSERKLNVLNMGMEWLVELLEIFSGYLSNTLSFMRVAGLGIAHVSLMTAFFQIAEMSVSNGHYSVMSYVILLLGNMLVIGLEGLSAGIQSLRLNYYEFFSKYFTGNGKAYAPISLRSDS